MKIYLDNNLGVTNVEQEELTQDTIGYNILKVYIPNAVLTPYDTFTCYYGALLQNGRKVGWFAMEARTSTDADYEANYTLYKATLEQCVVSVEGKVYIGCQVLLGNSGNATLIKKNTAVVQFNVRKSVAINNDILVLDTDQTTTDVLESYKNLLENALTTYATKAEVYTQDQINALLLQKADKSTTYTKTQVDSALATKADRDATDSRFLLVESAIDDLTSVQNVVDVVSTKSALNSYDTSKLEENDKIQVIADETHDGASTVYNWNGSAWQYVGAYGTNSAPKTTAITHTGNQLQDYSGNNVYPNISDSILTRIYNIDGKTENIDFELGYIGYTSSSLSYTPSGNRCRTPQGISYHLKVGDIVKFDDFTNKRFLMYYELNGVYDSIGWQTTAYTVTIEADYVVMCSYRDQATITNLSDFSDFYIFLATYFEKEITDKVDDNYNELTTRLNYDKFTPELTPDLSAFSMANGLELSKDLANYITDIKRNTDLMVHCSSNVIINTTVYVLFYYNETASSETPSQLNICLCKFDITTPSIKTYIDIAKIGDSFDGTTFDKLYDCSLFNNNGILVIVFNAHLTNDNKTTNYYDLYKTYDTTTNTLSNADYCIFKLGNATYNFSGSNIQLAFYNDGRQLPMYVYGQLTINPRCNLYNGYYYVGLGCVTTFNGILKTDDFITFEFVTMPTFYCISGGEEVCYIKNNKCYYYMRQKDTSCYSILSYYDLVNDIWGEPIYIKDTQSRADLFEINSKLYLMHSPIDRNHIEIIEINTSYLNKSIPISCAYLSKSFYPYTFIYNNELYMTYTQDRKHLYLAKYNLQYKTMSTVINELKTVFNVS